MSRVSFENKTGYKLKITYDDKIYDLECTQRVIIPICSDEPQMVKVSIDEDYYFGKIMFSSRMSARPALRGRMAYVCYLAKFDMSFYDKDISTRKIEIKQHIRRFEYDMVFALLTLDVDIPVKYSFCDEKQKREFKIFNIINQIPTQIFCLLSGCVCFGALFTGLEFVNIFLALIGIGFLALFVSNIIKRHKLNNFNKYFDDILLFDSVPCLPIKIRKRTIIFDDEE